MRGVGEIERRAAEAESVDAGGGAAGGGRGLHEGVRDDDSGGDGLGVDGPDLAVAGVGGEDSRGVEGDEAVEELGVWYVGGVRDCGGTVGGGKGHAEDHVAGRSLRVG